MPDLPTFELVSLLVPAGAIALAVLWLLGLAERRRRRSADLRGLPGKVNATFLFHDDRLVDTDAAHPFLPGSQERGIESWADLRTWLDGRFGTLPDNLSDIARKEPCRFGAARPDDGGRLTVSAKGQMRKSVV